MAKFIWNEEVTQNLVDAVEGVEQVSQDQLEVLADELGTTKRSVGSKLRKMGYNVAKASDRPSAWSLEEEAELVDLLNDNQGVYTYGEIAGQFQGGKFTDKQVQGKILSLEMTSHVKPTPKKEVTRTYTEEQEVLFIQMAQDGASLEDIAEAMGKSLASARGKALSLFKTGAIEAQPVQVTSNAKAKGNVLEGLDVANLTVAEIAEATAKSERGIKGVLSRAGVDCVDYKGAERRAQLDAAAAAKAD